MMPHTLQDLQELFADRSAMSIAIMINGFTGFRTTLIEELTPIEIEQLYEIHAPSPKDLDAEYNALKEEFIMKEWRSNILALAEKANIKEVGSFGKFNNWMVKNSRFKKQLTEHTLPELRFLHQQLRGVFHHNTISSHKTMNKAWWTKAQNLKNYN